MANPEHLAKLQEGVEAWNQWRDKYFVIRPDLQGANLQGANLQSANLQGANLQSAFLSKWSQSPRYRPRECRHEMRNGVLLMV